MGVEKKVYQLRILEFIRLTDFNDEESVCDAYQGVWHAQCTLLSDGCSVLVETGLLSKDRAFDNYDIDSVDFIPDFIEKLGCLLIDCAKHGIEIV